MNAYIVQRAHDLRVLDMGRYEVILRSTHVEVVIALRHEMYDALGQQIDGNFTIELKAYVLPDGTRESKTLCLHYEAMGCYEQWKVREFVYAMALEGPTRISEEEWVAVLRGLKEDRMRMLRECYRVMESKYNAALRSVEPRHSRAMYDMQNRTNALDLGPGDSFDQNKVRVRYSARLEEWSKVWGYEDARALDATMPALWTSLKRFASVINYVEETQTLVVKVLFGCILDRSYQLIMCGAGTEGSEPADAAHASGEGPGAVHGGVGQPGRGAALAQAVVLYGGRYVRAAGCWAVIFIMNTIKVCGVHN